MRSHRRRRAEARLNAVIRWVLVIALASASFFPGAAVARDRNLTLPGDKDFFLQITAGPHGQNLAVHTALLGAYRRLGSAQCRGLLSDFTDAQGRTLQERLEATGETAQGYLRRLSYTDGAARPPCARGDVVAFTSVGGQIIYVCRLFTEKFLTMRPWQREELEIGLIHEVLHTLGLRENPPTSQQITDRVLVRCGDQ